ncbi:LOW QUALITY PROTEIN: uncharacterized protein C1orf167 homolog [Physeter macrocephalus]|uniref:LOW QUALITY PROTEIN: uncharacterized protein C1orf167 homolog n=1 Tax=Physeter macrocephalus TaxID=9755 RepID=A0A455B788_PHYMC|nr:LOW QUALITY PROTEIN: uncharacterized protein C1orf167 homolog [Physeter catodon]|eukprot:XP_028343863.1 LOW QUALITY PROTEIN: uncharacterized protein C1orf167 homolog [Physeter catodon]
MLLGRLRSHLPADSGLTEIRPGRQILAEWGSSPGLQPALPPQRAASLHAGKATWGLLSPQLSLVSLVCPPPAVAGQVLQSVAALGAEAAGGGSGHGAGLRQPWCRGLRAPRWTPWLREAQLEAAWGRHTRALLARTFRKWRNLIQQQKQGRLHIQAGPGPPSSGEGQDRGPSGRKPVVDTAWRSSPRSRREEAGAQPIPLCSGPRPDGGDRGVQILQALQQLAAFLLWCHQKEWARQEKGVQGEVSGSMLRTQRMSGAPPPGLVFSPAADAAWVSPLDTQCQRAWLCRCFGAWQRFVQRGTRYRDHTANRRAGTLRVCLQQWVQMKQLQASEAAKVIQLSLCWRKAGNMALLSSAPGGGPQPTAWGWWPRPRRCPGSKAGAPCRKPAGGWPSSGRCCFGGRSSPGASGRRCPGVCDLGLGPEGMGWEGLLLFGVWGNDLPPGLNFPTFITERRQKYWCGLLSLGSLGLGSAPPPSAVWPPRPQGVCSFFEGVQQRALRHSLRGSYLRAWDPGSARTTLAPAVLGGVLGGEALLGRRTPRSSLVKAQAQQSRGMARWHQRTLQRRILLGWSHWATAQVARRELAAPRAWDQGCRAALGLWQQRLVQQQETEQWAREWGGDSSNVHWAAGRSDCGNSVRQSTRSARLRTQLLVGATIIITIFIFILVILTWPSGVTVSSEPSTEGGDHWGQF